MRKGDISAVSIGKLWFSSNGRRGGGPLPEGYVNDYVGKRGKGWLSRGRNKWIAYDTFKEAFIAQNVFSMCFMRFKSSRRPYRLKSAFLQIF